MTGPAWRLAELAGLLHRRGLLAAEPLLPHGAEPDPMLRAVGHDSRRIHPGDLFVARPGRLTDGHLHVAAAVEAGAAAVVVERPMPGLAVPQVVVRDAMTALGVAAAWRAGDPSHRLGIVGITGTDGKTTTAYLTRAVLEAAGHRAGLIGTTDVIVGGISLGNAARTSTPEAPELQAHLAAMLAAGDDWAVVESTSHGLAQQRVAGIAYDVAVLTNVTSEHLEFHGTREAYQEAKRSLFSRLARSDENPEKGHGKHAVVNADDALAASVAGDRARGRRGRRPLRARGRRHRRARAAQSAQIEQQGARGGRHQGDRVAWSPGRRDAIGRLDRHGRAPPGRALQRPQRPGGHGRGDRPRPRPRRRRGRPRVACPRCPGAWSGSTRASPSASSSTMRTRQRPSPPCSTS